MNENLYDALKLLIHFWALSSEPWGQKIINQSLFMQMINTNPYWRYQTNFALKDDLTENSQRLLLSFKQIFNSMTAK